MLIFTKRVFYSGFFWRISYSYFLKFYLVIYRTFSNFCNTSTYWTLFDLSIDNLEKHFKQPSSQYSESDGLSILWHPIDQCTEFFSVTFCYRLYTFSIKTTCQLLHISPILFSILISLVITLNDRHCCTQWSDERCLKYCWKLCCTIFILYIFYAFFLDNKTSTNWELNLLGLIQNLESTFDL